VFYALNKLKATVTGDIGCYALGAVKPLDAMDTIVCMGASIGNAFGFEKAGDKRRVAAIIGDSTFFHSGMTGLLNVVYNRGASTIIVLDNRTTAMTGHQDHPGTGRTLMGQETKTITIEQDILATKNRRGPIKRTAGFISKFQKANVDAASNMLRAEANAQERLRAPLIVQPAQNMETPITTSKRLPE